MKRIIILVLVNLTPTYLFSQDNGYIALSVGPSIPFGDFADKNADNKGAGFAKSGAIFDISFSYRIVKKIGISVLLRGQANEIDNVAFAKELARKAGGSWSVDENLWSTGAFLFGGYGTFPISEKIFFDSKILIGFLSGSTPKLKATLDGSNGSGWVRQETARATAAAVLISAGLKFNISKKVCLLTNLDYFGGKPEFKDVETTSSLGGAPAKDTFSQSIQTVNASIGIGIRLSSD